MTNCRTLGRCAHIMSMNSCAFRVCARHHHPRQPPQGAFPPAHACPRKGAEGSSLMGEFALDITTLASRRCYHAECLCLESYVQPRNKFAPIVERRTQRFPSMLFADPARHENMAVQAFSLSRSRSPSPTPGFNRPRRLWVFGR